MDPIPTTSTRVRTPPTLLELTNRKQLILQRINILRSKLPYNPNSTELTFRLRFPMSAEQMNDISRELNALTNELRVTERQIASTNSKKLPKPAASTNIFLATNSKYKTKCYFYPSTLYKLCKTP